MRELRERDRLWERCLYQQLPRLNWHQFSYNCEVILRAVKEIERSVWERCKESPLPNWHRLSYQVMRELRETLGEMFETFISNHCYRINGINSHMTARLFWELRVTLREVFRGKHRYRIVVNFHRGNERADIERERSVGKQAPLPNSHQLSSRGWESWERERERSVTSKHRYRIVVDSHRGDERAERERKKCLKASTVTELTSTIKWR